MLHLRTETYNNKKNFRRFLGRILAETCLEMDYLGSKSPKIAKRWGLRPQTPLPPCARDFLNGTCIATIVSLV